MHADIRQRIGEIIAAADISPRRALEIGGRTNDNSLLRFSHLEGVERYCVNLEPLADKNGIKGITANGNDLHMFADGYFDLVVSNATLEHDPHFWLSLAEMRRVLRPGGLLVIGVPGIVKDHAADAAAGLPPSSTLTYRFHMDHDYYRFTALAVRKVFFGGFRNVEVEPILVPPRLIGSGRKPRAPKAAAPRGRAVTIARAAARRARRLQRRLRARVADRR